MKNKLLLISSLLILVSCQPIMMKLYGIKNPDILKNQPVPIPPLSEQKRIVAEIEKQLALTQQLKEKVLANQQATEQLLKTLLHQAFEVQEIVEARS